MGPGPDDRYLEDSGYRKPRNAAPSLAFSNPLKVAAQFIPPLAIGLLMALIVGGVVFWGHARNADDRLQAEQRIALRNALQHFTIPQEADPAALRLLEGVSGVTGLRWEAEPEQRRGREMQSLQDANGRITSWLTWDSERPVTAVAWRFMPVWAAIAAALCLLCGLSMWYVRGLEREVAAANARTRHIARHDPVSGLPEASATIEALEQALARREPDEFVTLCYFDLTGFREMSDAFGRPWSNDLVRAAAARLREVEGPNLFVGHLGRHRFILILRTRQAGAGLVMAREVEKLLARPLSVHGQNVQLRTIMGIASAPRDGLTSEELFRHATLAMRVAKRGTQGDIVAFEPMMEADLQERRFLERELKRALDEDALQVHYQPIVSGQGGRILGVEALARWHHPTHGNIPPKIFVPVAEQTGLMVRLGEYVLYRALHDAKRWPELFVSVNLSPIQVKDRALLGLVKSMLAETQVDPARLVLEITEGVLIDDPEESRVRLEEIRSLGVRIALDDFGSGFSSLAYLQRLPFDKLKIDRSFVAPVGKTENSAYIIQALVALGRALDLSVLVEGVETEEQRVLLQLAGCDEMQGYLFGFPAKAKAIDQMLLEAKLGPVQQGRAQAS